MEGIKKNYSYIGRGVLRGCIITTILIVVMALISSFSNLNQNIISLCILIITMASIVYGAIYATKKIRNKGWLVGLSVALIYILIIYLASLVAGRDAALSIRDLWRSLLGLAVGCLSGMLGINL
ncbi:TIGR04086 family membrane protein [Clostridium omnivorum]|uniref:Membrane protein n=1 Tax=Clostridium omnivorum TaxID=1604902 RepID=A0ABQ5N098_9CLOT|nr:TIGR04086 family membrane protein [Clostridium sp. E14]GLC28633.1 membrane protein [Clostridium sp. E14]